MRWSNITQWTSLKLRAMCSCSGCNKTHKFFSKADQHTMVFLESMWSVSWAQKKIRLEWAVTCSLAWHLNHIELYGFWSLKLAGWSTWDTQVVAHWRPKPSEFSMAKSKDCSFARRECFQVNIEAAELGAKSQSWWKIETSPLDMQVWRFPKS